MEKILLDRDLPLLSVGSPVARGIDDELLVEFEVNQFLLRSNSFGFNINTNAAPKMEIVISDKLSCRRVLA